MYNMQMSLFFSGSGSSECVIPSHSQNLTNQSNLAYWSTAIQDLKDAMVF